MNTTQKTDRNENKVGFFAKLRASSIYARIFALFALVLFIVGVSTLGSFNGTGKKLSLPVSSGAVTLAYRLDYKAGEKLDGIYVNVGTIYAEPGGDEAKETLYVQGYYYHESDGDKHSIASMRVANIFTNYKSSSSTASVTYRGNANYNWIALTEGKSYTYTTILLNFTARVAADVNEVAFVNQDGKVISASVATSLCKDVDAEQVKNTIDRQGSFHKKTSARYYFTQEEEYILETIDGLSVKNASDESGNGVSGTDGYRYIMTTDYNSFGVLVYAFFTLIFGKSTFGLRLPSFLATFGAFLLVYCLGKNAFRSEKYGLVLSAVFALGGFFFSIGRVGTPLALVVLSVVAGIYFMQRFYAKGLSASAPVRSALPVLFSGLSVGAGIAVSGVTIFPALTVLVVFIAGIVRLFRSCNYKIAKLGPVSSFAFAPAAEIGDGKTEENGATAEEAYAAAVAGLKNERDYGVRVSVGLFLAGFVAFTVLLMAISALITYPVYARYYVAAGDQANFMTLFLKGFSQCFVVGDFTQYSLDNYITPWSWLISLRGATMWNVSQTVDSVERTAMWNAQGNTILCVVAAFSLVFSACYVVFGGVLCLRGNKNYKSDKRYKNALRAFVILFWGALFSLVPYLNAGEGVSAENGYLFQTFYLGFIALFFYILETLEKPAEKKRKKSDVALMAILGLALVYVVFTSPMCFGFMISETAAKVMYNWAGILGNGRYGLIPLGK